MPKGKGNKIIAIPSHDVPYVVSAKDAPDSPGLDPVTVDVELRRGVWIEGKISDKVQVSHCRRPSSISRGAATRT